MALSSSTGPAPEPAASLPNWLAAPPGGWTADDLDHLPGAAPRHVELLDGVLVVRWVQRSFHARVMMRLGAALDAAAPPGVRVEPEMTIKLGHRQRPEPDVVVFHEPVRDASRTYLLPEDVLLVVEIVSPESEERDRETKPLKYAKAGIRHFWRVEEENARPVVHVYELDDTTGQYVATGIERGRLRLSVPFAVDIDVRALY
ncbi:Uma2 family endonuclease [Spiractinospora alimapuensis]|uniref:Uma2 family endonuclease n=1 Tax=Spiractinospora alimapuensis TaxID=2820884 RepID=UPI001F2CAD27|nr:Uma2 family endonuclease [Spiractinospora alimapuensis]QVQ52663.1 Uma2 family endonuclease [Spiractinospora alimapuensis]